MTDTSVLSRIYLDLTADCKTLQYNTEPATSQNTKITQI